MIDETRPVIRHVGYCAHCGNRAPQKLLLTHTYELEGYDEHGKKDEHTWPATYYVACCETCNEILVYHSMDSISQYSFAEHNLLYPKGDSLASSVPVTVQECYAEAARVKTVAPNAYAVMIRRALEALCDDRGVGHGTLHKRLAELAQRGEIPGKLAELTTILRQLGNAGAHKSKTPVTVPMTWSMDRFFRAIIEYVYVAPAELERFKVSIEKIEEEPDAGEP